MSLQKSEILIIHNKLREYLIEIPKTRSMRYTQVEREGLIIGKPRFNPPKYSFGGKLAQDLLIYFAQLKEYFISRNFEIREDLNDILDPNKMSSSKYSPIFLIENDVWNTDAVYGEYLIETVDSEIEVHYFRRNEKRGKISLTDSNIEILILADARFQVINQFNYLWDSLRKEIEISDTLFLRSQIMISNDYLLEQFETSRYLNEVNPIAACLIMGRCMEMFCKIKLNKIKGSGLSRLVSNLKNQDIITQHEFDVLDEIRVIYNMTKHDLQYEIDSKYVIDLWGQFALIIKSKLKK